MYVSISYGHYFAPELYLNSRRAILYIFRASCECAICMVNQSLNSAVNSCIMYWLTLLKVLQVFMGLTKH